MDNYNLLMPLVAAMVGLLCGALLKSVLRHSHFPYTVALFLMGLLTGTMNRMQWLDGFPIISRTIDMVANIQPDFILYVFLPILIFAAAYEMNLHIFKKTLANATLLAGPGLLVCMLLTAALMMGLHHVFPTYKEWDWSLALMFGALISATDPVAVIALLQELGTSKRFSTLVDGESLLNDGTGIVGFMFFFSAYTAGNNGQRSPFLDFIFVVAGGILLGYILARVTIWFITHINSEEMIQNSVIILSAYVTFILAQSFLGISGVIALVAFGLCISYYGRPQLKPQVTFFMEKFWDLLSHIANTLIFLLVGIIIAEKIEPGWVDWLLLLFVYISLNIIRYIMVRLFYPIMKHSGYGLTARESVILSWGGLRGALGMTLALMVSYTPEIPLEVRRQILFLTAGIVTLTLSVNATTMHRLLERLGLTQVSSARSVIKNRTKVCLRNASETFLKQLKEQETLGEREWKTIERFAAPPADTLPPFLPEALLAELRLRILEKEMVTCRKLYEEGVLSQATCLRLSNSLDELFDHDGKRPMNYRTSIFDFCHRSFAIHQLLALLPFRKLLASYFKERMEKSYELGKGFLRLQHEDLELLNELKSTLPQETSTQQVIQQLYAEIQLNISAMQRLLERLAQEYPTMNRYAIMRRSIRMLLTHERRYIGQLKEEGVLSDKDAEALLQDLEERSELQKTRFSSSILPLLLRFVGKKKNARKIKS